MLSSGLCLNFNQSTGNCAESCSAMSSVGYGPNWLAFSACLARCQRIQANTRCDLLVEERESLKTTDLTGCERLAQLVEYAVTLGYQNTTEMVDDISCALTDARGPNTVFDATFRFRFELVLGYGGWAPAYEDGTPNQAFHFWSYLNTVAQSGNFNASSLGNYGHECWAVAPSDLEVCGIRIPLPGVDTEEATLEDVRLTLMGMAFGFFIHHGAFRPDELAGAIRNTLCVGAAPFPMSDSELSAFGLNGGLFCPFVHEAQ